MDNSYERLKELHKKRTEMLIKKYNCKNEEELKEFMRCYLGVINND